MIKILPEEFKVFSQYIHSVCGVSLDESKAYLVETRLKHLVEETGSSTFSELYYKVKIDTNKTLQRKIIDAITTGETSFFRDTAPFELLQHKILPDLIDRRSKFASTSSPIPIRIWSAACSTGQELYSIAIVLNELLGDLTRYNVYLLGTDISNKVIAQASKGTYNRFEVDRGLPQVKSQRYLTETEDGWKVNEKLRAMVAFRVSNLLEASPNPGKFDIIFCRNVAIYFSETDKIALFRNLSRALESDGVLIIGSTESLTTICPTFEPQRYLRSVYYRLRTE